MSKNNRFLSRTMAASLAAAALTCSGMATAHADEKPHGNSPAHAHHGGPKPQALGKGHQGNPGHPGSKGGNQGHATPGGPAQPSKGGPAEGGGSPEPTTPGEGANGPQHDSTQHNPPGNNGTVKIEQLQADGVPQNNPHQSCQLRVEWYGFDAGDDVVSQVSFAPQAPTSGSTISVAGDTSVPVGGDPASGAGTATGLDGSEVYTLSFTGAPHPQQGYHVKVTVHTPYSLGNDSKTKVFWIEPCTGAGSAAPATAWTPQATAVAPSSPNRSSDGTSPRLDNGSGTTDSGSGVTTGSGSSTSASSGSVAVPTEVDAGTEGSETARKALPFGLLALASAATAATVLLRRRAAQH